MYLLLQLQLVNTCPLQVPGDRGEQERVLKELLAGL